MRVLGIAARRSAFTALLGLFCGLAGCQGAHGFKATVGPIKGISPAEAEVRAEAVRRDPLAYIHGVAERCAGLEQYTLTFVRTERRGLFKQVQGPERIACWFRARPFSVRMKWLDDDVKYGESTYVENQEEGKVRFVPRHGFLGLPPSVTKIDLQTPVTWGESKYPLSDFGLARMMQRTLDSIERAGDQVVIRYEGLKTLPDDGPTVHHLFLEYPESQYRVPIQNLYIDVRTDLPAGTLLEAKSGALDAAYFYRDLRTDVQLNDADFLLEAERPAAKDGTL